VTLCLRTLSSLSTALLIVLILSVGTPHIWKMPSKIFLWLILMVYFPFHSGRSSKTSLITLSTSASGSIESYWPAMSKSHW
jgi:hypothetical protein